MREKRLVTMLRQVLFAMGVITIAGAAAAFSPWNLDRINQRGGLPDNNHLFLGSSGQGITIYVVGSGMFPTHVEFDMRAQQQWDSMSVSPSHATDCWGTGTSQASLAAGQTLGIANAAQIRGIALGDCEGQFKESDVWQAAQHIVNDASGPLGPSQSVVLFAVAIPRTPDVDLAIRYLYLNNFLVIVPAGDTNEDACNVSPAGSPHSFTVGASGTGDNVGNYVNYGPCVDIYAPGSDSVTSADHVSESATTEVSGSFFAAAQVAGAAAIYLGDHPQNPTPDAVMYALTNASTQNALTGLPVNNSLLYVPPIGGAWEPEPEEFDCTGLWCTVPECWESFCI